MSETQSPETHLGNPVTDRPRITLEDAIEAYKAWAGETAALVETADQSVTHSGFEELLEDLRSEGEEYDSVTVSRLVDRFTNIESHILDEGEVRSLMRRYPAIAFDDSWSVLQTEPLDEVGLLLTHDDGRVKMVEIAFETDSRAGLGRLLHERERLADFFEAIEMCLVVLDADDYFTMACERAGVQVLELGPEALISRVESSPDWGNLRGFTLSP
jgi:hypothetical protein